MSVQIFEDGGSGALVRYLLRVTASSAWAGWFVIFVENERRGRTYCLVLSDQLDGGPSVPGLPVSISPSLNAGGTLPPCGRENSPYRHPANIDSISIPGLGGVF